MMHRQILGLTDSHQQADHRDTNRLNNRRSNLRPCTNAQNQANSHRRNNSGYKGVQYRPRGNSAKPYFAHIKIGGEQRFLGSGATAEEVARIYDKEAKKLFGVFAYLNFPND